MTSNTRPVTTGPSVSRATQPIILIGTNRTNQVLEITVADLLVTPNDAVVLSKPGGQHPQVDTGNSDSCDQSYKLS